VKPFPTTSIIVPTYNRSDLAAQVLEDITRHLEPDTEILLVDDGSTDDTQAVAARYPHVTYLKHEENRGVSPAWNTGIKAATGDYCVIVNNDVRINDDRWCSKLIESVKGKKAIAGPEIVDFNSASHYKGRNMRYINGWMWIFPRRFFAELGLFEEAFAPASFEDVEISTRAQFAGYTLEQVSGIRAQHAYSQTVNRFLLHRMPELNMRNRDIWLKKMDVLDRPRLKIVIDCASNGRKWGPTTLEEEGLGGAETALTLLTRELVSRGHKVLVFNDATTTNGDDNGTGVSYHHRSVLDKEGLDSDVFIAFRCPSEFLRKSTAKAKIFWSCDQQTTEPATWERDLFPYVQTTVCISDYHRAFLSRRFGKPINDFEVIGCPVRAWDYEPHLDKDPNRFLYCSVPHRGLDYMPMVMRELRKALPEAILTITSDYRLWGANEPRNEEFRSNPLLAKEEFLGKVSRDELIRLQGLAMAQPYPCTYEECFCIAVAECSTAGAVPISTAIGAVPQTVGDDSRIVGPPIDDFAQRIAKRTLELHGDRNAMRTVVEQSWRHSVVVVGSKWEELLYRLIQQAELEVTMVGNTL
jgi:GT2 family glycosyltransferase/glycosyltransferase involved in cell wall biosynthesis